jgi:hypothetical protein
VPLEQRETRAVRPRSLAERRAACEHELRVAYAAGDRERVSELRVLLAALAREQTEGIA